MFYIVRHYLKANTLKPKREKIEKKKQKKNPKNLQADRQTEAETETGLYNESQRKVTTKR